MGFDQIMIAVFGTLAIGMTQQKHSQLANKAWILGLIAQPFFLMETWQADQMGQFIVAVVVTGFWIQGSYNAFTRWNNSKKHTAPLLDREYSSLSLTERNDYLIELLGNFTSSVALDESAEMHVMNEIVCEEDIRPLDSLNSEELTKLNAYCSRLFSIERSDNLSLDEMKELVSMTSAYGHGHMLALMCRAEKLLNVVAKERQSGGVRA